MTDQLRQAVEAPTPEKLEAWAAWFDSPSKCPYHIVFHERGGWPASAGYVLRQIASALRTAQRHAVEGTDASTE